MATGATGTPTTLGIPKLASSADAPSGVGINNMMDAIDALLGQAPLSGTIAGIAAGSVPVWNGSAWVKPTGTPDGSKFLRDDGAWAEPAGSASVTPVQLLSPFDGNSFWTVSALTGWYPGHWSFVTSVNGYVYGQVLVPEGVTSANVRLALAANATTGVTRMNMGYAAIADGESLNPASLPAGTAQDVTVPGTAYLRKDVTFPVTGLADADYLAVYITHEGVHANDTLAVNTLLFGAWLEPS